MPVMSPEELLHMALMIASRSRDPNTQVGSVLASNGHPLQVGYNRFPAGVRETTGRLSDRDLKLKLIIHAEMDVILRCARAVDPITTAAVLYTACTDGTGAIWGGPPCVRCCVHVIDAGIREVVSYPMKASSKWKEDLEMSLGLLHEAGVTYRELPAP